MTNKSAQDDKKDKMTQKIEQLEKENEFLRGQCQDLLIALSTTAEHGDIIEEQTYKINLQLQNEIAQRKKVEIMLKALVEMIYKERNDLEIMVKTLMEHGDIVDAQWQNKVAEAIQQANIDPLTKIANRRKFDDYLTTQLQKPFNPCSPLSLIICDIDYFKLYNDNYGHLKGDLCLQQVAQALKSTLKRPGDLLARYGGEEFAVILPDTPEHEAIALAKEMQKAIDNLKIPHPQSKINAYITISIGVGCVCPSSHLTYEVLFEQADFNLYQAKNSGRNKICP